MAILGWAFGGGVGLLMRRKAPSPGIAWGDLADEGSLLHPLVPMCSMLVVRVVYCTS